MNLQKQLATRNECYIRGQKMTPRGLMLHSTGANNPTLRRYVYPDDGLLGPNVGGQHFNQYRPGGRQVCPHGFIGLLADNQSVASYQTLPWDMVGWHSGSGNRGSANYLGYIGIEICEDGLTDRDYFRAVYREAVELFAYLCKAYNLDPMERGVVICHSEGHAMGIASTHADVMHWFPRHGKSMDTFRAGVKKEMEEDEDMDIEALLTKMTDEQAYRLMAKANAYAAQLPEPAWSQEEGHWKKAAEGGTMDGTEPERAVKRCELAAVLGRKGLL